MPDTCPVCGGGYVYGPGGRSHAECHDKRDRQDRLMQVIEKMLREVPRTELFSAEVNEAVDAFLAGEPHPVTDELRQEIQAEEEAFACPCGREIVAADKDIHRRYCGALQLTERVAELESILLDFTQSGECRFDHHGNCQEHGWFDPAKGCPNARAKAVLTAPSPPAEG